ncbi:M48 family metallopeptidase [Planotetraspora sp. A-T 1434]|uniref:M48 family metallopeptidase n=1 Tax=Planotetraspora sp. A-T 1434 TaxID=2979219 RepID=UPI0021C21C28|nr:M48 family metallopeptidase [Planotetraspora sp. A-T 1434]MCT9932465.1 M48 family metallopeptidase [Planotetraspora sp. A-T 1434]
MDPSLGDQAVATSPTRCGQATTVTLGADLLDANDLILHGVLAHEVAHHHLGHPRNRALFFLAHAMNAAVGCGLAALSLHLTWVAAVLFAAAGMCRLVSDWLCRRCEYAADEHAVALLNAAGFPGARAVAAMVDDCAHTEPRWVRWGGWLVAGHPTVRARAARLAEMTIPATQPCRQTIP